MVNFGHDDLKFLTDIETLWDLIMSEVPAFCWDDDDETLASTVKSKSTKKPTTKETAAVKVTNIEYNVWGYNNFMF